MNQEIKGWDKLQAQLEALGNADYLPALLKGARQEILPEMQALTPVDEGDLRDSEDVFIENETVVVFAGTDHAVFVEMGTSKMEAQPYMRPAVDGKTNAALRVAADEINKIMEQTV